MSAMTREVSNDVVLVVRAARRDPFFEATNGNFVLSGSCDLPIRIETAPRWQPLSLLRDEDATWEDAEWQ